jgi:prepilin-type N-terminal cleavage/methylation domain-containing protein/prepilin-type processing-associated H-X9-DG protein
MSAAGGGAVGRGGFTVIELLVVVAILGLLAAVLLAAIQSSRESSRRTQCSSNLRQLGVGLQTHHEQKRQLPPAVVWKPPGEPLGDHVAPPGTLDRVSLGLASATEPDRVYANWLILILPYLEEQPLKDAFDLDKPIADARNAAARAIELPLVKCPSDGWNGADNHFQRAGLMAPDAGYARGNFALNGGSNDRCLMRLSKEWPPGTCSDGFRVNGTDLTSDTSQVWGSGIGGVNKTFRFSEFPSGLSKTVAIEEIRAGVHPLDRRGAWALGFPGSSITVAHGIHGNKGPNAGADDLQGCGAVSAAVPNLAGLGMPCSGDPLNPRAELCQQATARSTHPGGVNLLMTDGSAHFVTDAVDAKVWHEMHKRDSQAPFELPF